MYIFFKTLSFFGFWDGIKKNTAPAACPLVDYAVIFIPAQLLNQLDTVHPRHTDIRKNQVRVCLLYDFERFLAISRNSNNRKPMVFPMYHIFQIHSNNHIIIND